MWVAVNGIVICVLLFAWGAVTGDKPAMAHAVVLAGLAWPVNVLESSGYGRISTIFALACAAVATFAIVRIAVKSVIG
jgi:hypothetical protein